MTHALSLLVALVLLGASAAPALPPQPTPASPALLSDAAMEQFLAKARVVRSRDAGKGVTASSRATLTDGTLTHDAHIQTIEESKTEFRSKTGVEFNFRDSWRFNVAVYKLDRLLGLQIVPVSVARTWNGRRGAFTWWVDDVQMDEGERLKNNIAAPDTQCWNEQTRLVRMLDQLIDNVDRNLGNMLITKTWRVWAIDHTRAFRFSKTPRSTAQLNGVDRTVLQRLEALDFASLKREMGEYVSDADIRLLLSRRDGIVAHFKSLGAGALYDRRDPTLGCSSAS